MTVRQQAMRRQFPAATAAIMVELAREYALVPADVLNGTALDEVSLSSPDTTISLRDSMTMLDNCLRLSADPVFALEFGSRITLAALGALGYALMSCDDLEQLLGILLRYHRLLAGNFGIHMTRQPDGLVVVMSAINPSDGRDKVDCEVFMAAAVSTLHKLLPGRELGLSVSFSYPAPAYRSAYERLIGPDISFAALSTQMRIPYELLELPLQFANPTMRRLYQQQCDALLWSGSGQARVTEEVRRYLLTSPGRFPGIEGAAAHFHMSARTLRRRLEAEGWTYQRIVHDMRRRLAETYLQDSLLSIPEIAQMLGYGDASNFRRAFINWTGISPAACRRGAPRRDHS